MRLLNTTTLKLHEFFGINVPPYANLSHRWTNWEVTFQDLNNGNTAKSSGWAKIAGVAQRLISAELSEAINSMFRWYQASQICYTYLFDVTAEGNTKDQEHLESELRQSKWFTRGWTLQELLAPDSVIFFNRDWVEIGTKSSLRDLISSITWIEDLFGIESASIAQRMSWASSGETLRPEDMAYCLLGLFGVNIPLLHGEGDKAFLRLQIEIMRVSDDESIFAWTDATIPNFTSGLLARSPAAFRDSGDVELLPNDKATPYS
ncbi:uncharacterized protein PAC_04458 [Phialocephala subalpina]|uniref:Heterokaryon incompatibility domain-containing protein n=1 Tax=Phialocephala subalpina TaxID=576137 RepID=A0A1L7WP79_9HELO|nr:uncharacterized protein PAC_04458 [Phialocephala subalpina]